MEENNELTPGCRANAIIAQWQTDCLNIEGDSTVMAIDIAAAIREAEERGRVAGLKEASRVALSVQAFCNSNSQKCDNAGDKACWEFGSSLLFDTASDIRRCYGEEYLDSEHVIFTPAEQGVSDSLPDVQVTLDMTDSPLDAMLPAGYLEAEDAESVQAAGTRLQPRKPDAFGGVDFDGVPHGNLREEKGGIE